MKSVKNFFTEFKNFAVKGNAFELALAVVVGAAFTGIVNSLVGDIVTPLLGLLTNNVDFKTLSWAVNPTVVVKYGAFLQAIFNFLVVSLTIFIVFKLVNSARKRMFKEEEKVDAPVAKSAEVALLEEIRDLLKK